MKNFSYLFLIYLLFLVVLIALPFTVFSQKADSLSRQKFDVGFNYSADYNYRSINSIASNRSIVEMYDSIEKGQYGSTCGLNGIYTISDKIQISLGILFSDKGYKTNFKLYDKNVNYNNHFYYIDIPVKANYFLYKKKIYFTAGISSNIYLKSTVNDLENNSIVNTNLNLNKINFMYLGGFGYNQQMSESWYFKSEILFRHSINPIMKAPINRYFYSLGFSVGLLYQIK